MTLPAFPAALAPGRLRWGLAANTQSGGRSPITGSEQTLQMPGARWVAELSWQGLDQAEWRLLSAFLAALGGSAGRFTFGPVHAPRRAAGSGTPLVNGAAQSGAVLNQRGWAAGAAAFLAGDWFSYADPSGRPRLHQVTADVTANAQGQAAVPIAPPIRRAGNDGAAINIAAPVGVFRLSADDDMLDLSGAAPLAGATIRIEEAVFG